MQLTEKRENSRHMEIDNQHLLSTVRLRSVNRFLKVK